MMLARGSSIRFVQAPFALSVSNSGRGSVGLQTCARCPTLQGRPTRDISRTFASSPVRLRPVKGSCPAAQRCLQQRRRPISTEASLAGKFASTAVGAVKFVTVSYGIVLGIFYVCQRSLLFPRSAQVASPTATGGELLQLEAGNGSPAAAALYFAPRRDGAPIFVFFHGNADQLGWGPAHLGRQIASSGLGFLAVEYPGYGVLAAKGGHPTEESLVAASAKMLEYFVTKYRVDNQRLCLFGQSIGCAVALHLAARGIGGKLVLVSPFLSIPDVATSLYPMLAPPIRLLPALVKDHFDNKAKMASVSAPTMIVHGTKDEIVPVDHGTRLAELTTSRPQLRLVPGVGHNDVLSNDILRDIIDFASAA